MSGHASLPRAGIAAGQCRQQRIDVGLGRGVAQGEPLGAWAVSSSSPMASSTWDGRGTRPCRPSRWRIRSRPGRAGTASRLAAGEGEMGVARQPAVAGGPAQHGLGHRRPNAVNQRVPKPGNPCPYFGRFAAAARPPRQRLRSTRCPGCRSGRRVPVPRRAGPGSASCPPNISAPTPTGPPILCPEMDMASSPDPRKSTGTEPKAGRRPNGPERRRGAPARRSPPPVGCCRLRCWPT